MIRDLVRAWWRLELGLADADGRVLDGLDGEAVVSNSFCRMALASEEGSRRCAQSMVEVRGQLPETPPTPDTGRGRGRRSKASIVIPAPIVHRCHMGFDVVSWPIHIDGALAGFLYAGGAYAGEPSPSTKFQLYSKMRELIPVTAEDIDRDFDRISKLNDLDLRYLGDLLQYGAREIERCHADRARRIPSVNASQAASPPKYTELVGTAPAIRELYRLLDRIVPSESTVLIQGESGTGKELIARAIHYYGPRSKQPFVVQNCSAFNDNLLESALFGHVRGAFTGAVRDHKGLFENADGGTFFLDEIGDMSAALQVKLLRVLQEGTFTPVGATKQVQVDVRIIAATHKDLAELVARGEFREDLYYRINVLKITVPPLRERLEDLPLLADHFIRKHYRGGGDPPILTRAALEAIGKYHWPGNIRELENEIERLLVLAGEQREIDAELLSPRIRHSRGEQSARPRIIASAGTLREMLERAEAEILGQGLVRTQWNAAQLAKELGISRANLIQKCAYYGLEWKE